jgi:hypothetical protein
MLHEYESRVTLLPNADPNERAVWVGETATSTSAATGIGQFAQHRTTTWYNSDLQPARSYDEGWLGRATRAAPARRTR